MDRGKRPAAAGRRAKLAAASGAFGKMLVREWKGKLERVRILQEGFAWNGQTFGSPSQIARAMTGTNWNGHRFFGLRQAKTLVAMKQRDIKKGK